jgi:ribonuclease HII
MVDLHARYPEYGFLQHMGYPTPVHLAALRQWGACPEHRHSFSPVRVLLDQATV